MLQVCGKPLPLVKTALVIDDDKMVRTVLAKALAKHGVTDITIREDGVGGLAIMKSAQFDLVLSDLEMPNMDGRNMILAFRAWELESAPRRPRQRVVCWTGAEDRVTDESLLQAGFDEVQRKPVHSDKVATLVGGAAATSITDL